jgi:dipeptidyl-peptidase-4
MLRAPQPPSRRSALLLALAFVLLGTRAPLRAEDPAAPAPALTLERAIGGAPITAPLPDWAWRPGHSELVRVLGREKRELLVALDPGSGKERTLLDLTSLEGLVPGKGGAGERGLGRSGPRRLLWTSDGTALAALVKGERVWVDLASGAPRRLTEGGAVRSDVQVAPDGRWLSYEAGNCLWCVPTRADAGGAVVVRAGGPPEVLVGTLDWVTPEELGHEHAAWWSPDATRLVVLTLDQTNVPTYVVPHALSMRGEGERMRYPRAGETNPTPRLEVVTVAAPAGAERAPTGVPLQVEAEYVVRVAWTPDSARVLVLTLDRSQTRLTLRSCDPVSGACVTLSQDLDPAWHEPPPAPRFVDANRCLLRTTVAGVEGWWLLTLDAARTAATRVPLTDETWVAGEVLHVDGEACCAWLSAYEPGARRRSLWRVGWAKDVGRERVLGDVEQDLDVDVDDPGRYLLVRRSGVHTPPVLEVRDAVGAAVVRTLGDARSKAFDALALPEVEEGATDLGDARALWRLFKPRGIAAGARVPLVLSVYGGPGSRTVEDRFGGGLLWTTFLTQRGFAVLQVDGRGTGGQGAAHERLLRGRLGDVDHAGLPQVVAALAASRPWLDATRVGIWGWSYGGTMACDALTRRPDVFRCGVAVAPVTDWRLYDTIYTERYMGLPAAERSKPGYDATSSVELAKAKAHKGAPCRLLLLHGLADDNVHPVNTLRLVEALLAAERTEFDWHLYADRGHGLGNAQRDVFRRTLAWFERHLKGG